MDINVIIVEDDKNTSLDIKEYIDNSDHKSLFNIHDVRTIEGAIEWINESKNSNSLKVCILDLMFPPKKGKIATGNTADLTPGIIFYEKYLKGKYKVIILTGALRWKKADDLIREKIKGDENVVLMFKPTHLQDILDTLLQMVSN
jgi:DNA-binding NarL/FixJ family response regulator